MFAQKVLTFLAVSFSLQAVAAPTIQVSHYPTGTEIVILMDQTNVLAQRLADGLIQSTLVEELNNAYVKPKTHYKGEGFSLRLEPISNTPKQVELRFFLKAEERAAIVNQGGFLRFTARTGTVRHFHHALLASSSSHVITDKGEAVIFEGTNYAQKSVSCEYGFNDSGISTCYFQLQK